MRSHTRTAMLFVALSTLACSSDDPTGPGQTSGTFTATVDGVTWNGQIEATATGNNGFTFSVQGVADNIEIGLSVNLTENNVPGTVDLTSGSTGAQLREGGEVWYAVGQGGSGTMTIQTLTPDRATGTFEFVAGPVANSASGGTRTITNGRFDISF